MIPTVPPPPRPETPYAVMDGSFLLSVGRISSPDLGPLGLGCSPGPWKPSSRPDICVLVRVVSPVPDGSSLSGSGLERLCG